MNYKVLAFLGLGVILTVVFSIGTQTTYLGPYSDNLHLLLLSATTFFTFLAYVTFIRRKGR